MRPIPTPDEIEAARTDPGGWTRDQLAEWGLPWPPPKGWRACFKAYHREGYDMRPVLVVSLYRESGDDEVVEAICPAKIAEAIVHRVQEFRSDQSEGPKVVVRELGQ